MKKIVTTTCVFPPPYPSEVILNRLAAIGYTSLDIGLDYCVGKGDLLDGDSWRERVMALRRQADALGVTYTHSHAPGNAGNRSEPQMRAFEAAALLGARYIVVHPIHEMDGQIITDDAEFIRVNLEATLPLLPMAEKLGLTILSENILWGSSVHPRNIVELVKAVDLVFVEVKARRSEWQCRPMDVLTPMKIRNIVQAADAYVRYKRLDMPIRYDLITISGIAPNLRINHYEEAFYSPVWYR